MSQWREFILQPGEVFRFEVLETLWERRTAFQHVEILNTSTFGKAVMIDQKPQSSQIDHRLFNEVMVHAPLAILDKAQSVLMVGGGPGSGLAELVKYKRLQQIVLCDLDSEAVAAYKQYLPEWHRGAYEDARVQIHHEDARTWLAQTAQQFDVIYLDIPDPLEASPARTLFTVEFYKTLAHKLSADGILISQAGRTSVHNLKYHAGIVHTLREVFPIVESFERFIPFYAEAWGFVWASRSQSPFAKSAGQIDKDLATWGIQDRQAYEGRIHHAMFALPNCVRAGIEREGRIHSEASPLIVK